LQKVFRRRSSESKGKQPASDDDFEVGEHKDGFYKYSQEMLEEKKGRFEPRTMRASDSAEVYYMRTSGSAEVTYMSTSSRAEVSYIRGSDSTEASYASAVSGLDILSRQFAKQR
jgi:predicted Zn-dependent protease